MRKDQKVDSERDEELPETPSPEPQADGSPRGSPQGAAESGDAREDGASSSGQVAERADQLRRDAEEQRDKYLRLAAEFDNYRKRTTRERQESGARAQADLVRQMLDALDDLARVTALDPATTESGTVIEGVEMVERKLLKALTNAGLELLDPVDEPFNPELHEAVSTAPALSAEDDSMVSAVFQMGYLFKGQLIRPARVVVKQWNG